MRVSQIGIIASGRGGYDTDYQAYLDYLTAQSLAHPSTAKKTVENAFMIAVKAAFSQSTIAACPILQMLMFKTDAASGASLVNWHNPGTRTATAVSSPIFTSDSDWNTNGTTSYINTNTNITELTANDFTILTKAKNTASDAGFLLGGREDTGVNTEALLFNPRNTSDQASFRVFPNLAGPVTVAETDGSQRWAFGRTNASNIHYSKNGAAFTSVANTSNAPENANPIYLLAFSDPSLGAQSFRNEGIVYYIVFTRKLTDGENAAIDAALVNYLA